MIRRPPSPPLFPYTTLFRSSRSEPRPRHQRGTSGSSSDSPAPTRDHHAKTEQRESRHRERGPGLTGDIACATVDGSDRKSTRLNSSHPSISYAVFCLKKKKK